jgi:hypothetical protein
MMVYRPLFGTDLDLRRFSDTLQLNNSLHLDDATSTKQKRKKEKAYFFQ